MLISAMYFPQKNKQPKMVLSFLITFSNLSDVFLESKQTNQKFQSSNVSNPFPLKNIIGPLFFSLRRQVEA